jgi:hypothetical protein
MILSTVLVLATLAAGHPIPQQRWVDQERSFGHVDAFRVRADLHTKDRAAAATLKAQVERQMEAALRRRAIAVTGAPRPSAPHVDGTADLIVDVHLVSSKGGTAVSWSFHVSQPVRLATGRWSYGSTWEVGDLLVGPPRTVGERLRASLEPALDEFCAAFLASSEPVPKEGEGAAQPEAEAEL